MKWFLSLSFLTVFFIVSSFFIGKNLVFAYRFMTLGMAIVSFLFYTITIKNNPKNINGNLLAITLKFLLSAIVFIAYFVITRSQNKMDYYFFILAYLLFSVVCYVGAYYHTKNLQHHT